MPSPLLSICIPTYNRAECLKQCLDSIVAQWKVKEVYEKTEVVISDNGSSDHTKKVVEEFQARFPQIIYHRNEENLGFDKNVLGVVSLARGEYCWLLGDDDGLFKDSLIVVLDRLEAFKLPYYIANNWGYDEGLIKPAVSQASYSVSAGDKTFQKLDDYITTLVPNYSGLVGAFGGMSSQIFQKSFWSIFPKKEKWIGSQCIHALVLLSAMQGLPMMIISEPLVKTRSSNMRWHSFPGLETVFKRTRSTLKGAVWILELYNIPYSRIKVYFFFFQSLVSSLIIGGIKKMFYWNPWMKSTIRKYGKIIAGV